MNSRVMDLRKCVYLTTLIIPCPTPFFTSGSHMWLKHWPWSEGVGGFSSTLWGPPHFVWCLLTNPLGLLFSDCYFDSFVIWMIVSPLVFLLVKSPNSFHSIALIYPFVSVVLILLEYTSIFAYLYFRFQDQYLPRSIFTNNEQSVAQ